MGEGRWDGNKRGSEVWGYSQGRTGFGRGRESGYRELMRGDWLERVGGRWSQVGGLAQMGGQPLVLLLSMKGPGLASDGGRGYLPQNACTVVVCVATVSLSWVGRGVMGPLGEGEGILHIPKQISESSLVVGYAGRSLLDVRPRC